MINPGTSPLDNTREDLAVGNLDAFLTAVLQRAAQMGAGRVTRTADLTGWPTLR